MLRARPSVAHVSAACLTATCIAAVADQIWPNTTSEYLAGIFILAYVVLQARLMAPSTRVLLGTVVGLFCIALLTGLLTAELLRDAGARAGYFAFFVVALQWLSAVAVASPAIGRIGTWAAHKSPSWRYASLSAASHAISVLLLAGSASLLGSATRSATEMSEHNTDPWVNSIRRRRMISAVVRSSAAVVFWAPTTLNIAVLTEVVPGLTWSAILLRGLAYALIFMLLGGVFDYLTRPRPTRRNVTLPTRDVAPGSLRDFLVVAVPIASIFLIGTALHAVGGVPQLVGLLLSAFVVAVIWAFVQAGPQDRIATASRRLGTMYVPRMTKIRTEIGLFAAAASIGVFLTHFLDPLLVGQFMETLAISPDLVVVGYTWVVVALGIMGISPVVTVSATAGPIWASLHGIIPVQTFALAVLTSSAVCAMITSFSIIVRFAAAAVEKPVPIVGLKWNGAFAALILVVHSIFILVST